MKTCSLKTMDLPEEIVYQIILGLDYTSILAYSLTHRDAIKYLNDKHIWKVKAMNDHGIDIKYVNGDNFARKYHALMDPQKHFDSTCYNMFSDIIKKLKSMNIDSPKMYFSGEADSNQSDFEIKSNHLEVGVLARNKIVGQCLLSFVRYAVDANVLYYEYLWHLYGETKILTVENAIEYIAEQESIYTIEYNLDEPFTTTLRTWDEYFVVTNDITNVDIWTIARIEQELDEILSDFII